MRLLRRAVALILVIVVVAAALVPPVAAADDRRMGVLDILQKIGLAWGGDDVAAIYCHNCGAEITVEDLEGYDGALAGAVCGSCGKSLMFDSGSFPVGGFRFSGGGTRGAGAGGDDWDDPMPSPDPSVPSDSQAFLNPSGHYVLPAEIVPGEVSWPGIIRGNVAAYTGNANGVSFFNYHYLSTVYKLFYFQFVPPYSGDWTLRVFTSVSTTYGSFTLFDENQGSSYYNVLSETSHFDAGLGVKDYFVRYIVPSTKSSNYIKVYPSYDQILEDYVNFSIYHEAWWIYEGELPEYQPEDNEIVDTGNKTIIVNGDTIAYNTLYDTGDTYIMYQDSGDDAPAIVYVKDPQTGEVIGMSWYDPSSGSYYYTDFTYVAPTPTPAPTSVPGPTATPDPGGDGGDGGDDGSGGGIWDTIAQGIADFIGVLGKLLGGILSGFVNLLTELVGSLTAVVPLIENISGVLSGLYSFLPESWQLLLNSAFTFLLVFAVVKLVLGFGK